MQNPEPSFQSIESSYQIFPANLKVNQINLFLLRFLSVNSIGLQRFPEITVKVSGHQWKLHTRYNKYYLCGALQVLLAI